MKQHFKVKRGSMMVYLDLLKSSTLHVKEHEMCDISKRNIMFLSSLESCPWQLSLPVMFGFVSPLLWAI